MKENISGLLAKDQNGHAVQSLAPGNNVADDVDGVTDSNVLPTGAEAGEVVRVACTQDTYIKFGGASVTATATDILMPAGVEYFKVPDGGTYIAYLQVSAAGRISVTLMV